MKKIFCAVITLVILCGSVYGEDRTWGVYDPVLLNEQGYAWEPNMSIYLGGGYGTFGKLDVPDEHLFDLPSVVPQWEVGFRIDPFYGFMMDIHGGQFLNEAKHKLSHAKLDLSQQYLGLACYWVNRNILPKVDLLLGGGLDSYFLQDKQFDDGLGFQSNATVWSILVGLDYNLSQNIYMLLQAGYRFGKYNRFLLNDEEVRWVHNGQDITYDLNGLNIKLGIGLKL